MKTPNYNKEYMILDESHLSVSEQSLVFRLQKRAEIRRKIPGRKSVEEGTPDRIADLLEEAALKIQQLEARIQEQDCVIGAHGKS